MSYEAEGFLISGGIAAEWATPLAELRWVVSARNDFERVLQQAFGVTRHENGIDSYRVEWRNVPEVVEP